jgi:hypothetical protein
VSGFGYISEHASLGDSAVPREIVPAPTREQIADAIAEEVLQMPLGSSIEIRSNADGSFTLTFHEAAP